MLPLKLLQFVNILFRKSKLKSDKLVHLRLYQDSFVAHNGVFQCFSIMIMIIMIIKMKITQISANWKKN